MAGPSSPTSPTDFEAFAESYLETRHPSKGSRTHRSSRWEWPISSNSLASHSSLGSTLDDDHVKASSPGLVNSIDHASRRLERKPRSPSWSEMGDDIEDILDEDQSPLIGYSYEDIGVQGIGGRPFRGEDWSDIVEQESLEARARSSNNTEFGRGFIEGTRQMPLAARRGIPQPPILQTSFPCPPPCQSPALSPVAKAVPSLQYPFPSPLEGASPPLPAPSPSPMLSAGIFKSPECASFGNAPYTQNLLFQVTQQLARLAEALGDQQDELEKHHVEPIVSSQYFRRQLAAFDKRVTVLEQEKIAREAACKPELGRQQPVRFDAAQHHHRVYPKEHWPSSHTTVTSFDHTKRSCENASFERQGVENMAHAAAHDAKSPIEAHLCLAHGPIPTSFGKKKSAAHPLLRGTISTNSYDTRIKAGPTAAANLVTAVGKAAITVIAAVSLKTVLENLY
ncbi:MAG: hypothetical protein Q9191_001068 [Dirinaria sp. TL-2023a]